MYCKKCGSEIAEDAVFCPKCGQKQTDQTNIVTESIPTHKPNAAKSGIVIIQVFVAIVVIIFGFVSLLSTCS